MFNPYIMRRHQRHVDMRIRNAGAYERKDGAELSTIRYP